MLVFMQDLPSVSAFHLLVICWASFVFVFFFLANKCIHFSVNKWSLNLWKYSNTASTVPQQSELSSCLGTVSLIVEDC